MLDENDRMRGVRSVDGGGCAAGGHAGWWSARDADHARGVVVGDGVRGAPALPRVIANWKHWLTARYGIAFQANFWDTRLRDEAHYAEKFRYVCNNPVRKGLCASAREWRTVIAFDRASGAERSHR